MAIGEVVAAIPTYNNAEEVTSVLPQVMEQNYSAVFVMDDASTDGTPDLIKTQFGSEIKVLGGRENVGPAANRNKVMPETGNALVHFFDADTRLNSSPNPEIIRELFNGLGEVGYVGGMVRNPSGRQMPANFGPRFSFRSEWIETPLQGMVYEIGKRNESLAKSFRSKLGFLLEGWPDTEESPPDFPIRVFGATEANLIIQSPVFRKIGGFDSRLRYFEASELAVRLERARLPRYFYPAVDITHAQEIDMVEGIKRLGKMARWSIPVIGSVGVIDYFFNP